MTAEGERGEASIAEEKAPLAEQIDPLSRVIGYVTAAMLFGMLLIICYDVMMRYVFNEPTIWVTDLSTYMLIAISFLGLTYVLAKGGHIRVEILIANVSPALRTRLELVTSWIGVLFVFVATWQVVIMLYGNYVNNIRSYSLLTTPIYQPQIPIAVGLFIFGAALMAEIYRLAPPSSQWRRLGAPLIAVAVLAALVTLGLHPKKALGIDIGVDPGLALIFMAVFCAAWLWSGWRVVRDITVVLGVAIAILYGGKTLTGMAPAIIIVVLTSVLLAAGMRVALALGSVGMLAIAFLLPGAPLMTVSSRSWESLDSFTLTAIPMFVLMGSALIRSGLTEMLMDTLTKWVGGVRGGIAYAGVTACTIFSAVSGSSVATAATIGMAACPEMIKRGYSPRLAYGTIAAGGTLGILIPPSIVLILYGSIVGVPIVTLFIAGIIPGLLLSLLFMVVVFGWTLVDRNAAPALELKVSWAEKISSLGQITPILVLILGVLGVLYAGVATPTEAAAIATLASLAVCWWRGRLSFRSFLDMLLETVVVTSFLLFIVVCASFLSYNFDLLRLPVLLVEAIQAANLSPGMVLAVIVPPIVVLGMFLDPIAMLIMTLPVLFPIIVSSGLDPVWFGVIFVLLIEISLIFPPLGMNLLVLKRVSGAKTLTDIGYGALPFMAIMAIFIYILYMFPEFVTWLPGKMAAY